VQLTVGMPVGLLGAPSSGKTSLSLDILRNTSRDGIHSAFFSMDMYGPLVYLKQIQKHEGLPMKESIRRWKTDPKWKAKVKEEIDRDYKNVRFSLRSGHTVQEMRDIVLEQQDRTGEKIKLVLIDYLECISGPYSDPTANTAKIAGELKDFAMEMGVCVITLVQPPKSAGDASEPLLSMRNVKGASMLEQSFRVILGIYREGFSPQAPEWDRFITVNALKNTMGPLFSVDNYWDGIRGEILQIDSEGLMDLKQLRERRQLEKQAQQNSY
jgi:replicative DNA helicase